MILAQTLKVHTCTDIRNSKGLEQLASDFARSTSSKLCLAVLASHWGMAAFARDSDKAQRLCAAAMACICRKQQAWTMSGPVHVVSTMSTKQRVQLKVAAEHHHTTSHADYSQYGPDRCIRLFTRQIGLERLLQQAGQLPADPSCLSAHSG